MSTFDTGWSGKSLSSTTHKRCADSHKPLPIEVDGKTYQVQGGSVYSSKGDTCDVVVALDGGHASTPKAFPWTDGLEFHYPISDSKAPKNAKTFKQLIVWLGERILAGDKVWVGCIGGHGRTGMVLSALVAHMTGMKDATTYVRENYCARAVESTKQVDFLKKHYGVTKVKPTKDYTTGAWPKGPDYSQTGGPVPWQDVYWPADKVSSGKKKRGSSVSLQYVPTETSIHGKNSRLREEIVDKTLTVV